MRKSILATTFAIAGLGLAVASFAHDGARGDRHFGGHGGHGRGDHIMRELESLNLSDEQRTSIRGLFGTAHDDMRGERDAMRELHRGFMAATPGTPEYATAATRLADAEAASARERVRRHAEVRAKVYDILTPAQRTQLQKDIAEHLARHDAPDDGRDGPGRE